MSFKDHFKVGDDAVYLRLVKKTGGYTFHEAKVRVLSVDGLALKIRTETVTPPFVHGGPYSHENQTIRVYSLYGSVSDQSDRDNNIVHHDIVCKAEDVKDFCARLYAHAHERYDRQIKNIREEKERFTEELGALLQGPVTNKFTEANKETDDIPPFRQLLADAVKETQALTPATNIVLNIPSYAGDDLQDRNALTLYVEEELVKSGFKTIASEFLFEADYADENLCALVRIAGKYVKLNLVHQDEPEAAGDF